MEIIGNSSLWVEKYRPKTINDLILPQNFKNLFQKFVVDKDIPNILFVGQAGKGKTSTALSLCNDLGSDVLFINASMETGIDTLRYKVSQFAMTSSFTDGKKIVILDEFERLNANSAQDALKGLLEQTEANCRFILTTNNIARVIDPIKSRCQIIDFNFNQSETKNMVIAYFKRLCYILDTENVKYDKKVLSEFIQKMYPDFRRTLNELQKFVKMHNEVSEAIFQNLDGSQFMSLIEELKNKKFNSMRKIISSIDSDSFYQTFYDQMCDYLDPTCIPSIVLLLGEYSYKHSITVSKEINLAACCTDIMKEAKWK